jgi:hypothetical protein
MKNSNDTIGNRTRDLPACRAVPQPTAPPQMYRVLSRNANKWITTFTASLRAIKRNAMTAEAEEQLPIMGQGLKLH